MATTRQRRIISVPGIAIAIAAMVLGIMLTLKFVSSTPASAVKIRASFLTGGWEILGFAMVVAVMVVLKTLADRQFRLERDLLEAFLKHIPDNVYFKDRNSRFLRINRAMAGYFGLHDPEEAVNKTDAEVFSSEHADRAFQDEQEIIRTGQPVIDTEEKETWPDGRESWVLTTKVPLKDRRDRIIGTMGISHNITERKEADARIRYMALHDALTGLPNRILLAEMLTQAIAMAHRTGKRVAVLMMDLDRFKNINDTYGHYVGDRLLEAVATRLKGCLRESDIVARLGGDEFLICLPEADDKQGVEQAAQKVLAALAEPLQIESQWLQIGASIGICQYPIDGENEGILLQSADAALYESKRRGRGTYSFFVPELTQATRRRQKLEGDLRQACAHGELSLHYQPLVKTDTGRITAVEALLRWRHPELGSIPPAEFVPLLEELGLIAEVGAWVLRTACFQNVAWQRDGLPPVRMAINVAAQQFYRGDIVNAVKTVLRDTGMDPQWLELELTESLTVDDSGASLAIMEKLKRVGVNLSLGDFGTGWTSLLYLKRFPFDRIKIDRSFLRDIESQSSAEAVVRSMLNLGRSLGLSCVAEGVETHEQLAYLQHQKCAEMQGFLYSSALPAEACAELMRSEELRSTVAGGAFDDRG